MVIHDSTVHLFYVRHKRTSFCEETNYYLAIISVNYKGYPYNVSSQLVWNLSEMSDGMKKTHPCAPLKRG
jgi:hypothetical protein